MKLKASKIAISATLFLLSACSYLGITSREPPRSLEGPASTLDQSSDVSGTKQKSRVEIVSNADLAANATLSDVEVLWQIPQDPVEGFVVNYGFDRAALTHKTRILSSDLERLEDPRHGFVYRFVLANVPLDKTLYVSISAFSGDKISRPSDIFEVQAGTP